MRLKANLILIHSEDLRERMVVFMRPFLLSEYTESSVEKRTHSQVKPNGNNITKLRGLSPHANYTDRAAAAGRRS